MNKSYTKFYLDKYITQKRLLLVIVLLLLGILIGVIIGFIAGSVVTIKSIAEVASRFVDEELINQAIYQYQNHISHSIPSLVL